MQKSQIVRFLRLSGAVTGGRRGSRWLILPRRRLSGQADLTHGAASGLRLGGLTGDDRTSR